MTVERVVRIHCCRCAVCQARNDLVVMHDHEQINLLLSRLSEPQRRWYVGTLAQAPGGPSIRTLMAMTGLSSNTILRGRWEMERGLIDVPAGRQRHVGGGKPKAEKKTRALSE